MKIQSANENIVCSHKTIIWICLRSASVSASMLRKENERRKQELFMKLQRKVRVSMDLRESYTPNKGTRRKLR